MLAGSSKRLSLLVTRGIEEGARLDINGKRCIVGRAHDCDLVLSDLAISRHHLVVQQKGETLSIRALEGKQPFYVNQTSMQDGEFSPGTAITLGGVVLCVVSRCMPDDEPVVLKVERTEARTLLQGPAAEVRGMAAVTTLIQWLEKALDRPSIESTLLRWARLHGDASGVKLHIEGTPEDAEECEEHTKAPDDVITRETTTGVDITVPAHAYSRAWVTFLMHKHPAEVDDTLRRLLLVAGRVTGAFLGRNEAHGALQAQLDEVRQIAIGSARSFLGDSVPAMKLVETIHRVAPSSSTILIIGETGVGKTFAARLIHESSPRASQPLRVLNCAAIPESLLESELFGHEKGAFTGATSARPGVLEAVGAGTIVLDEISELPRASQAKLLRVLEEKKFERLGSNRSIELRARIICATNRDLSDMAKANLFRPDLLYRISVITIRIPPLRERGEDMVLLAKRILSDLSHSSGRRVEGFSEEAMNVIRGYPWPGNVRELKNAIEHALVIGRDPVITPEDFPAPLGELPCDKPIPTPAIPPGLAEHQYVVLPAPLDVLEKRAIEAALAATGGHRAKAAAMLGISRYTLYKKLLEPEESETSSATS